MGNNIQKPNNAKQNKLFYILGAPIPFLPAGAAQGREELNSVYFSLLPFITHFLLITLLTNNNFVN